MYVQYVSGKTHTYDIHVLLYLTELHKKLYRNITKLNYYYIKSTLITKFTLLAIPQNVLTLALDTIAMYIIVLVLY